MSDTRSLVPTKPSLARRVASRAVTVALILAVVSIPASLIFACGAVDTALGLRALAMCTLPPLAFFGLRALRDVIRDRLLRRSLRRQLATSLQRAGLADADPRDPRRAELERTFWRESQARALVDLRRRFAYDPEPLDIFGAVRESILDSEDALKGCAILAVLAVAGGALLGWFNHSPILQSMAVGLGFWLAFFVCALLLLAWESLAAQRQSLTTHRAFVTEQRRIATMAELSGGLSLADEQPDALRGAISPDVAHGGEVELVAWPAQEQEFDPDQYPSDKPTLVRRDGPPGEEGEHGG